MPDSLPLNSQDHCVISAQTFNRRAEQYQQKYMDVSLYKQGLSALVNKLPSYQPQILELGCGPGNVTRFFLDSAKSLGITATDLAPNMVALARENCPEAFFEVLDCRDLSPITGTFDAIVCGFVLPYLNKTEVRNLCRQAFHKLNAQGYLYISTMEGKDEQSGMQQSATTGDKVFIHYHQADFLIETLQSIGFSLVEQHRVKASETSDTDLVILLKKP